jgi:glycosyltransferase involved in cell wall biosynthesis
MEPLVSIIIPSYNRAEKIIDALKSIQMQTYSNYEIIVVDDGSKDNTVEKLQPLVSKNKHLRLIKHEKNKGAQAARNTGIRAAKGEWIAFLDSDDQWLEESLKQRMAIAKQLNVSVVHSNAYILHEGKSKEIYYVPPLEGFIYEKVLAKEGPIFPALLVKKEALVKIGYLDEKIKSFQEWDTCIRLARYFNFGFEPKPTFIYDYTTENAISRDYLRAGQGYEQVFTKHWLEILFCLGPEVLMLHYNMAAEWYQKGNDEKNTQRCKRNALIWKVVFSPMIILRKIKSLMVSGHA